jgi:hypothetical protein
VDSGNTVILIEHNLDVIKNSDWLIDLGPGAGDRGGKLIATGTPEQLAVNEESFTGKYLKNVLSASGRGANADRFKVNHKSTEPKTVKKPGKIKAQKPSVVAAGD